MLKNKQNKELKPPKFYVIQELKNNRLIRGVTKQDRVNFTRDSLLTEWELRKILKYHKAFKQGDCNNCPYGNGKNENVERYRTCNSEKENCPLKIDKDIPLRVYEVELKPVYKYNSDPRSEI